MWLNQQRGPKEQADPPLQGLLLAQRSQWGPLLQMPEAGPFANRVALAVFGCSLGSEPMGYVIFCFFFPKDPHSPAWKTLKWFSIQ